MASLLDQFLVSENIIHSIGEIVADVLPAVGFDHWPVCLTWDWSSSSMGKSFHFEQLWLEHKDFKDLVNKWWQELVPPPKNSYVPFSVETHGPQSQNQHVEQGGIWEHL